MTHITNPRELPDCFLNMQTAKDEADALRIANGRQAWMYKDGLGVMYVYVTVSQ
jgi:hypothetical protein